MMKLEEYIYMKTVREINKHNWVNKKKIKLLIELLIMRLGQLFCFIGVLAVYFSVWYFCSTSDILYLIGWWIITGAPISMALCCYLGVSIKTYKRNTIRKINKMANIKFKHPEPEDSIYDYCGYMADAKED